MLRTSKSKKSKILKFSNFRKKCQTKFLEHVEKSEIKKSQNSNNFGE